MNRVGVITFFGFWAVVGGGLTALASKPSAETSSKPVAAVRPAASASASEMPSAAPPSAASAAPSAAASVDGPEAQLNLPDLAGSPAAMASAAPAMAQLGDAPKSVRFGAIIVRHRGAQATSPKARSREDALEKAQRLQKLAQEDFKEAVKQGDPGSVENAGKMFRGILEPTVEVALFRLKKGEISDVVPTPRGFIIFRRRK